METKFYYSYNTEGNAFLGKFPALKNPRRQTEYLLPAMATFIEPPKTNKNEIAVWNGEKWVIESDFRGLTQVDIETKETSKIEYIGEIKNGFQLVSEEIAKDIQENPNKYKKIKNKLEDISDTEEYKAFLKNQENEKRKTEIECELNDLDTKRIRAMCEPSVKDETTGQTWLDYYNSEVQRLREELKQL